MATDVNLTARAAQPIERVWTLLTTDTGLAQWFWPMFDDVDYRFEPTPGAYFAIRTDSQGMGVHGQVTEATAPTQGGPGHVAYTWIWDATGDQQNPDAVSIDLRPDADGTVVEVAHHVVTDAEAPDIQQGWRDCLDRLEALR